MHRENQLGILPVFATVGAGDMGGRPSYQTVIGGITVGGGCRDYKRVIVHWNGVRWGIDSKDCDRGQLCT